MEDMERLRKTVTAEEIETTQQILLKEQNKASRK
jgi:hypothetical protein